MFFTAARNVKAKKAKKLTWSTILRIVSRRTSALVAVRSTDNSAMRTADRLACRARDKIRTIARIIRQRNSSISTGDRFGFWTDFGVLELLGQ